MLSTLLEIILESKYDKAAQVRSLLIPRHMHDAMNQILEANHDAQSLPAYQC